MPADRQDLRLRRIERTGNFVVIRNRANRLLIHFLDHVAFLQFRQSAVRIDIGDDYAVHISRQIELTGQFGRQITNVN